MLSEFVMKDTITKINHIRTAEVLTEQWSTLGNIYKTPNSELWV